MTGRELFEIWAPSDSVWSPWVSPALFAQIECVGDAEAVGSTLSSSVNEQRPSELGAIIIDMPGGEAVKLAMDLAAQGYRPVPIINASPGPQQARVNLSTQPDDSASQSVLDMRSLVREICKASARLKEMSFAADAPPAFILDSLRLQGTHPIGTYMFDNRWMVFPQDFPSARFLANRKIVHVTLIQEREEAPQDDLTHVLMRWQEAGIEILHRSGKRTTVSKPSRFKASWYRALAIIGLRRNSAGGFGSFIPATHGGG